MEEEMNKNPSRLLILIGCGLMTSAAYGQNLKPNQTLGYGEGELLDLTYGQNFDCIDQPFDDLNYNGIKAAQDPGEMQTPICQVGTQPSISPTGQAGNPRSTTEPLFVLVPMFSVNDDQNPNDAISCDNVVEGTICGSTLGTTLISLFGAIPEAFKASPLVYTQCPEPGSAPGTCTMHASRLDLGPVLAELGYLPPPTSNTFLPTPNHSHVLLNQDINKSSIWWQVVPVLVLSESDSPSQDGTSGITSYADIQAAEQAGDAVAAPSNFFLFFSSVVSANDKMHMKM
jgi:hypothetical protein